MKNIIAFFILICLLSCNSEERTYDKLQGFWWNGIAGAMYFNDSTSIFQKSNGVRTFQINSDYKLTYYKNNKKVNTEEFRFKNDTLEIADTLREPSNDISYRHSPYRYRRIQPINIDTFSQIYLSYVGEFYNFNIHIDKKSNYLLEVWRLQGFKEGKYKGVVQKEIMNYLNAIVNRTELLDENFFSDRMNACYPSWAAFIYTADEKKYKLQNNYKDDKGYIRRFGFIMREFPFLLDLKEGEFGDELEIIEEFRRNEDIRSWKEWNEKINLKE